MSRIYFLYVLNDDIYDEFVNWKGVKMDELATAIVDSVSLIKELFTGAVEGANVVAMDQATLMDAISSIVQNVAVFVTQLIGEIVTKL